MTRGSVQEYAAAVRERYRRAGKREKGRLLDEFCETTGYHRKAAVRLLRRESVGGNPERRGRPRRYGVFVAEALRTVWEAADRIGSKRLAPFLNELVPILERTGRLEVADAVREQLVALSASAIDRLLKPYRLHVRRRPYGQQVAPTSLKAQIPVRTFGEWAEVRPGSVQADLVLHCGETLEGFFLCSLVVVDVATGWTEPQIVWGKGHQRVATAMHLARMKLPVPLREIHTDNGGEFINHVLQPYCRREGIDFTRGRPYKKNDQAYVEQKNWVVVRRLVGYRRYSSQAAYERLGALYELVRLYVNFFQPIRKLVDKRRDGARVIKHYDEAATPYRRLLASGALARTKAHQLAALYDALDPVKLRSQIDEGLSALAREADRPRSPAALPA